MLPTIHVMDAIGSPVLRYLILPDGTYYGGNTHPTVALDHGPHVCRTSQGMLELFGRLAHEDDEYTVQGGRNGHAVALRPEMRADHLAHILSIKPEEVVEYYGLMVRVTGNPKS